VPNWDFRPPQAIRTTISSWLKAMAAAGNPGVSVVRERYEATRGLMRKTTTEEHRDVPGWLVLELVSEPQGSALIRSTQALHVVADGRMLYQGGYRFGGEEVPPEGG
jgi:hypothetical protein